MSIEISKEIRNELFFNLFALLWILSFLLASSHFIVTASACIWYNRQLEMERVDKDKKKDLAQRSRLHTVVKSVYWLVRYHLGSIAFGSLILAIVWALIIISEYLIVRN